MDEYLKLRAWRDVGDRLYGFNGRKIRVSHQRGNPLREEYGHREPSSERDYFCLEDE
jgi:hypothetical protein